jgi:hypothetical protein
MIGATNAVLHTLLTKIALHFKLASNLFLVSNPALDSTKRSLPPQRWQETNQFLS